MFSNLILMQNYNTLGVARYTDVMVRYIPRFDTISVQQGTKDIYYARFLLIYFEQSSANIKKNPPRCENTNY